MESDKCFEQEGDAWGLADTALLHQADVELQHLRRSGRPFNLTIYTVGTHIPGFKYKECEPYDETNDRFLQAVHCTDLLVGRWVEQLRRSGSLKDTILILTADHNLFQTKTMYSLFGDTANDHRLPLIAIGPQRDSFPPVGVGAQYDIAPTVLDLLGVKHNVRFPLGRSLIDQKTRREYFFSAADNRTYSDVFRGEYIKHEPWDCDAFAPRPTGPLHFPLTSCERRELAGILNSEFESRSVIRPPSLNCRSPLPAQIIIPTSSDKPLQVRIDGNEQRFDWKGTPASLDAKGLFMLRFTPGGELVERLYVPGEEAAIKLAKFPSAGLGDQWLIIWRADSKSMPPNWLNIDKAQSGLWRSSSDNLIQELGHQVGPADFAWGLTTDTCRNLLAGR